MKITNADIITGAATIYGEARGSTQADRLAVAHAILNRCRAQRWYGVTAGYPAHSIAAVCRKPWQFSCWNANDPNCSQLLAILDAPPYSMLSFRECLRAMLDAVDGARPDETDGATHYLTTALHTSGKGPDWSNRTDYVQVGAHRFFRGVA